MASKPDGEAKDGKAERLAAALRENLKRRKQQARGRATGEKANTGDSADKSPDAAKAPPKP